MSSRSILGALLVLATLGLSAASATGEEVVEIFDESVELAEDTADTAIATVRELLPEVDIRSDPESDAPPAQDEAPPAHEDEAAPEEDDGFHNVVSDTPFGASPLVGRGSTMLPLPVSTLGAAPRLDLGALAGIERLTPLAPAPEAARAPAYAPLAPAPAASPEPAPEPQAQMEPIPLALAVATAATATAPAAATFAWERLRRFAWIALLYSRIAKERLLDHQARERLLETIRAQPGLSVADLATATGAPRNTVTYHLRVLEREGLVSSAREGRTRLFFAPGSLEKREQAGALGALRHETTLAMARAIGAEPGVDQKALCARVGVSPSLAHWHADRLVASGLVDKRREGRFVRYYPGAAFELVGSRSA